jgi:hypothetical protein
MCSPSRSLHRPAGLSTVPVLELPSTPLTSERRGASRICDRSSTDTALVMTAPPLDRRSRSRRHTALHRTLVEGEQFLYRGRRRQLELDAFQQPRRLEFGVDGTDELPQNSHTSATIGTNAGNEAPAPEKTRQDSMKPAAMYGSRVTLTPVRASPAQRRLLGSSLVLSPVRVSSRQSRNAPASMGSGAAAKLPSTADLLAAASWAYSPNRAIPQPQSDEPAVNESPVAGPAASWRQTLAALRQLALSGGGAAAAAVAECPREDPASCAQRERAKRNDPRTCTPAVHDALSEFSTPEKGAQGARSSTHHRSLSPASPAVADIDAIALAGAPEPGTHPLKAVSTENVPVLHAKRAASRTAGNLARLVPG